MDTTVVAVFALVAGSAVAIALVVGARLGARAGVVEPSPPVTEPIETLAQALDGALANAVARIESVVSNERALTSVHVDHKKELIDTSLVEMRGQLDALAQMVGQVERERQRSHGELTEHLRAQSEGVAALASTTQQLRDALANVKARGQWGERMADDVLRLAGLIEGINYRKQTSVQTLDGAIGIPDFTFFMPNQRVLHMDVKFPIDNYLRFLDATNDIERRQFRDVFLRDVRMRVKELVGRGYLDNDDTVDCLLLFIPNEAVYGFVNQHDPDLIELAMRHRIVVCSPLTLFAVLAVVRQAVENFSLERRATEILTLLAQFEQQWSRYTDKLDKIQRSFGTLQRDFGDLMTTRTRALQRPLDKIAELRGGGSTLELVDDVALDA